MSVPASSMPAGPPAGPAAARGTHAGTMLTVAPAATDPPHLLRIAIDAEQVGAARIHLAADQADAAAVVAAIRSRTRLAITADPDGTAARFADQVRPGFTERVFPDSMSAPEILSELARMASERGGAASVGGRGSAALPVLLAALAVGLQLRVGTSDLTPSLPGTGPGPGPAPTALGPASTRPGAASTGPGAAPTGPGAAPSPPGPRDDIALIARAAGLARIAGRPAMPLVEARALLGLS